MINYVGRQFGSYRLLDLLGSGGFAAVYLGKHEKLKSQAAIKILKAQLLESDLESFLNEARTQDSLKHPNIIRIKECGIENDIPFLVMDYAPNGTLRKRHPRGTQVPLERVVSYVEQIGSALQYAHDRKLVHRDLKPENMLVGDGEILLSDFGIAIISSASSLQDDQRVAGTPTYMAPEQADGKAEPASDQYALGVIVYEWLCSTPPFQGKTFDEIAYQHLHTQPPSFQERGVLLAPNVEAVVMKALAKDPQKRYASVEEFATVLSRSSKDKRHPKKDDVSSLLISPGDDGPILPTPTIDPLHKTPQLDQSKPLLPPTILPEDAKSASTPDPTLAVLPGVPDVVLLPKPKGYRRFLPAIAIIGIFLLLGLSTFVTMNAARSGKPGSILGPIPTSTTTQPVGLSVGKTILIAKLQQNTNDCQSTSSPFTNNDTVWICTIPLGNNAPYNITWVASVPSDSSAFVTFGTSQFAGTVVGGPQGTTNASSQGALIVRVLTSITCPKTIPITIKPEGGNPLVVNWQCSGTTPTKVTIEKTTFQAVRGLSNYDCTWTEGVDSHSGWDCQIPFTNDEDYPVKWVVTVDPDTSGFAFNDDGSRQGVFSAHHDGAIKFHVPPSTPCSQTVHIAITLDDSETIPVAWKCTDTGVTFNVAPTIFSAIRGQDSSGCSWSTFFYNGWDCKIMVSNSEPSKIYWHLTPPTPDNSSITFPPLENRSGSIDPNQDTNIEFKVSQDIPCPSLINFTVTVEGGNPVNIQWNCSG